MKTFYKTSIFLSVCLLMFLSYGLASAKECDEGKCYFNDDGNAVYYNCGNIYDSNGNNQGNIYYNNNGGGGSGNPAPVNPVTPEEVWVDPCEGLWGQTCLCGKPPASGVCNPSIDKKILSKYPGAQGCSQYPGGVGGNASVSSDNKYNWTCNPNECGGSVAYCSAYAMPQVGKCGDSFVSGSTALVDTLPAASVICKRGDPTTPIVIDKTFTWKCLGTGKAADSGTCTATKVSDGQIADEFPTVVRVTYLTVTGRITPNIVNKGQYCTLSDLEYTTNPRADDSLVACGVYRGAQEYPDKSAATLYYQVEPGSEYVFKCKDYSTTIEGSTKPLKCVLNPSILER